MAGEDDVTLKLLIEAEDRSRAAFDQAKQNTRALIDQQKELWKQIHDSEDAEVSGNKAKTLSGEQYFATRKKAMDLSGTIDKSYAKEQSALQNLSKAHEAHTKGIQAQGKAQQSALGGAGAALLRYGAHFVTIAAAIEIMKRATTEYANWERGMARIELQTGKTSGELEHLGESIDRLSRMSGVSVEELQKHFMTFQAGIGEMNHEVETAFQDIVKASHASGVSVDVMARTAVAALKTMQVPYSELRTTLDQVVRVIPASAMSAWDAAGPKILGVMRSIGHSGGESVGQAALAFSQLTASLGSASTAANVQLEMLKKGTDLSTFFGKAMTPQLIELQKQQAGAAKTGEAFYQQMDKLGVFDDDPERAMFMQQRYGFSDEMVRSARDYHKLYLQIAEEVDKSGGLKKWSDVERAVTRLNQGPKAAVDQLTGALGELLVSLGKFLGPTIPQTLTRYVNSLIDTLARLDALFAKVREKTGSRTPEERDAQGNVTKPAEELMWDIDPAGRIMQMFGYGTPHEQRQRAMKEPGFAVGKPGFGVEDAFWNWILGGEDPGRKRQREEQLEKEEREGGPISQEGVPWGRVRVNPIPKVPQPGASPDHRPPGAGGGNRAMPDNLPRPGFAIGGEFEVKGQGGRDTEPVQFMATPGEKVAVTTPTQESLQQQQDKADIAMREHFARFHSSAFTKQVKADWWFGEAGRAPGTGPGGAPATLPGGSQGGGAPTTGPPGAAAPGSDGKVAPGSATSTAPAGSIPATLPGSVGSLGYEPGKFTPVPDLTTASGTSGGAGGGGGLAADRAKFARELEANPALREKIIRIAQNEQGGNPQGTQAVIESLLNRASYTGNALAKEARWTGERGYYAQGSMGKNMTAEQRAVIEKSLAAALAGGNVSNYGTDNASGAFAKRRIANDMYRQTNYINGEYFSTPGQNPNGPGMGNFKKYQAWLEKMKAGDAAAPAATKPSAVTTAKTTPNDNAVLPPGSFDPNLTKLPATAPGAGVSMPGTGPGSPISGELWQGVGAARSAYSNIGAHTHAGQDIGAKVGTPIHAEGEGVVVKNEFQPGAVGGIVTVKYKDGTTAKYMHLSNWNQEGIKPGAVVKPGQVVGLSGVSPGAPNSGAHLHVEYRDAAGKLVRPEVRHGWGPTNERGEGLKGRVIFAGIPGSYPKGTTREAALAASGGKPGAPPPAGTPTIKTATVKPSTGAVDPGLLGPTLQPTNKSATAPTNTKVTTATPADGKKTEEKEAPVPPTAPVVPAAPTIKTATVKPSAAPVDPALLAREEGGPTRAGTSYVIGEKGPEVFKPSVPGQIYDAGANVVRQAWDTIKIPGKAMEGAYSPKPEKEGWLSEEDVFRQDMARQQEVKDAFRAAPYVGLNARGSWLKNMIPESLPGALTKLGDQAEQAPPRPTVQEMNAQRGQWKTPPPAPEGIPMAGGVDYKDTLAQYREFAAEVSQPIRAAIEMPRAGPMRQRMSRRVEDQRERDVGRMTRYAAHSDIGMS
jgi:murein DD-endopeptidase MepM/ murein hydrolase activator NlpD